MPVNSVGNTPFSSGSGAPAAAAPPPTVAAKPDGAVGHGVTRLKARPAANAMHPPVFAGAAPPRGETAGAHGDHKGRISIR